MKCSQQGLKPWHGNRCPLHTQGVLTATYQTAVAERIELERSWDETSLDMAHALFCQSRRSTGKAQVSGDVTLAGTAIHSMDAVRNEWRVPETLWHYHSRTHPFELLARVISSLASLRFNGALNVWTPGIAWNAKFKTGSHCDEQGNNIGGTSRFDWALFAFHITSIRFGNGSCLAHCRSVANQDVTCRKQP